MYLTLPYHRLVNSQWDLPTVATGSHEVRGTSALSWKIHVDTAYDNYYQASELKGLFLRPWDKIVIPDPTTVNPHLDSSRIPDP